MFDATAIGGNIKRLRRRSGLTQAALAEKLSVSYQAVSGWENSVSLPDIENLCRLSEIFGVSFDELMRGCASSDERVMIAVDGGGTKSEYVLFTSGGKILDRFKLDGTNAVSRGIEAVTETLTEGIGRCLSKCENSVGVFVGTAGPMLSEIERILLEKFPTLAVSVDSDGVNALMSAEADAAVIAGTGSIVVTRENGKLKLTGGWGWRVGDPGSGYSFGIAALYDAFSYNDGVSDDAAISKRILEMLEIENIRDISYSNKNASYIASLAKCVFDAYSSGSASAEKIIDGEMQRLAAQIKAACGKGRVVLCGGIMENFNQVLVPFLKKYLPEEIEFTLPKLPPIYGAAVECMKRMGVSAAPDFFDKFEEDYRKLL